MTLAAKRLAALIRVDQTEKAHDPRDPFARARQVEERLQAALGAGFWGRARRGVARAAALTAAGAGELRQEDIDRAVAVVIEALAGWLNEADAALRIAIEESYRLGRTVGAYQAQHPGSDETF